MKILFFLTLAALAGCARDPSRARRYCMESFDRVEVHDGVAAFSCDRWCEKNGGCLCKPACPCKR